MAEVDWNERARQGSAWQSVIDPGDRSGLKNGLIDRIQWLHVGPWAATRRRVLDFGCGVGRFAGRIAALGVEYVGTDSAVAMIEAARRLHAGGKPRFEHVPALPLPFEDGRFDGVLTVGVLQCLKTADGGPLRAAVAELARVLAPGGELLMIEQASASGRHSGSVVESASEADYLAALGPHFDAAALARIRRGSLSRASGLYLRWGAALPGRRVLEGWLARHESGAAARAGEDALRRLAYHDVAIRAVRRP
jgi:SAM-dependent methyltransferase